MTVYVQPLGVMRKSYDVLLHTFTLLLTPTNMLLPQGLHFTDFAVKSTLVNSKPDKLW